jgi:hypothetical protein
MKLCLDGTYLHVPLAAVNAEGVNRLRMVIAVPPCIPDSHPYSITSTKCHINTAVSDDNGGTELPKTSREKK